LHGRYALCWRNWSMRARALPGNDVKRAWQLSGQQFSELCGGYRRGRVSDDRHDSPANVSRTRP
jgi:hypothetical protein